MRRFYRNPDPHVRPPKPATLKLFAVCTLAVLAGWALVALGPYGGAISPGRAVWGILLRVLVIAIPLLAMLWYWKQLRPRSRNVAGISIGVLVAALALFTVADIAVLRERVRMRTPADRLAERAFRGGDRRFLAVEDTAVGMVVPGIRNRCLHDRHGMRQVAGTTAGAAGARQERFRERAIRRAEAYNRVIADRLGISPEERDQMFESACPAEGS